LAVFFLAFAHRGFRALAIADVHHGPENADRIPFFPAHHVAALVDMPEPFRAAPEAVFPDPGVHLAIGGLAERNRYALPVLGMESFLPGLQAWDRVRAAAEQLAGAIVPPGFAGGGLELPNRIVGSPGDELETVDALAQYFPVPALLGDVHERDGGGIVGQRHHLGAEVAGWAAAVSKGDLSQIEGFPGDDHLPAFFVQPQVEDSRKGLLHGFAYEEIG